MPYSAPTRTRRGRRESPRSVEVEPEPISLARHRFESRDLEPSQHLPAALDELGRSRSEALGASIHHVERSFATFEVQQQYRRIAWTVCVWTRSAPAGSELPDAASAAGAAVAGESGASPIRLRSRWW